jgi:hypothetical protein
MNAAEFSKFIRSTQAEINALPAIEELLQKYPYSSILHMLYAKLLKLSGNNDAGRYINTAAIYSSDRKKLFRYINDVREDIVVQQQVPVYNLDFSDSDITEKTGHQNYLIDKFLNEKPNFTLIKDIDAEEEDIAGDPEIISETLAEIYLKQGKTGMAISTFEKLCLKFPEKSSYFAARIEKINKELLNNN